MFCLHVFRIHLFRLHLFRLHLIRLAGPVLSSSSLRSQT